MKDRLNYFSDDIPDLPFINWDDDYELYWELKELFRPKTTWAGECCKKHPQTAVDLLTGYKKKEVKFSIKLIEDYQE